jgi:hypothetical protein
MIVEVGSCWVGDAPVGQFGGAVRWCGSRLVSIDWIKFLLVIEVTPS